MLVNILTHVGITLLLLLTLVLSPLLFLLLFQAHSLILPAFLVAPLIQAVVGNTVSMGYTTVYELEEESM